VTPVANQVLGFNGSGAISLSAPFSGAFADLSGKPTTLGGYGITDALGGSTGGTDGALLLASGTGGATLQASTVLYQNSGKLGLGTASPQALLHLARSTTLTDNSDMMRIENFSANSYAYAGVTTNVNQPNGGGFVNFQINGVNKAQVSYAGLSDQFVISYGTGLSQMVIFDGATGRVGLHTTSPGAVLQIGSGTPPSMGSTWDLFTADAGVGRMGIQSGGNNAGVEFIETNTRTWGLSSIGGRFYVYDNVNDQGRAKFLNDGDFGLGGAMGHADDALDGAALASVSGNLGVGTVTPAERLSVDGNAEVSGYLKLNGVTVMAGAGDPEGAVEAPQGALFLRTDGGANTTLYVKESGTGNTGWVGK